MSANTLGADINEICLTFLLNNDEFPDTVTAQQYEKRTANVSESEVEWQLGRAEAMYDKFLQFLSRNRYGTPVRAYWTARPGFKFQPIIGFEVDQRLNPSDVLVELSTGKFYGISAKSTKSGGAGMKNPGIGTIDKYLGTNIVSVDEKYSKMIIEKFSLPEKKDARKQFLKDNPGVKKQVYDGYSSKALNEMRDLYLQRINQMSEQQKITFIATEWLNEDPEILKLPYVKITGSGTRAPYTAALYDPISNSKTKYLVKGPIKFSPVGNDAVGVTAANQRILKMRFKYASIQLASSLKMSGDTW
mgnify:FL=1|tara:strand:- start:4396 stop:5304 length:909 start_codon:yes stop_codon:yes gene_type:complete